MNIEKKDTRANEATLFIQVNVEDYLEELNKKLREKRQQADVRGFRKGKAPMSLIKRMIGNDLLFRIVYDKALEAFNTYIEEGDLNIIGQALPSEEQEEMEWDIHHPSDYTFAFDIGMVPPFELKGLSKEDAYTYYDIEIDKEKIERDIEAHLLAAGTWEKTEEPIGENMSVVIEATESSPAEGKETWETAFEVNTLEITEEFFALLKGKQVGDKIVPFNIQEVVKGATPEMVKKQLLNLDQEDEENENIEISDTFSGVIKEVNKKIPTTEDYAFYQQVFGEGTEVKGHESAIEAIKTHRKKKAQELADDFFISQVMENIFEQTHIDLPEPFLMRWIPLAFEGEEEEPSLVAYKTAMVRSIIESEIIRKYKAEITEQDVYDELANALYSQYPMLRQSPQYLNYFLEPMLKDSKEVEMAQKRAMIKNSLLLAKDSLISETKEIKEEDFYNLVSEANKKVLYQEEE